MVDVRGSYKIKDCTRNYLLSNGFTYTKSFYEDEQDKYTYRFPVYKYRNKLNLIYCTLIADMSGEVSIKITQQDGSLYQPYYNTEYGNYTEILNKIDRVILREFERLGIEKCDES